MDITFGNGENMRFITANYTDTGNVKKTNQDSMLIEQADTNYGRVLLTAVCDGVGGLAKGEAASACLVKRLSAWFYEELPYLLRDGLKQEKLIESWQELLCETNEKIAAYGEKNGIRLGTTCCAILAAGSAYYIMNIGDSRAYLLSDNIYQLTKDQTYCQREIDLGRMTPEEAAVSTQRSVLLQCVGASDVVEPDFFTGRLKENQCFLLCSDGFSNLVSCREIYKILSPEAFVNSSVMKMNLINIAELVKARHERDNISALLFKTFM